MNRRLVKVAAAVILVFVIFFGSGFALNYVENINEVHPTQQFYTWRSELKVESPFLYNVTVKQLFQHNANVPGFGNVHFLMNSMGGTLPVNITENYSNATGVGMKMMELVFLSGNSSSFRYCGFSFINSRLVGPNGTIVKMTSNVWAINNPSEYEGLGVANVSTGLIFGFASYASNFSLRMSDLPTGNYSLKLTMEFYDVILGFPVPVSSITFSLPEIVFS